MRSTWKGPFTIQKVYSCLHTNTVTKCFLRKKSSILLPDFIGKTVSVYNGCAFYDLVITASMVGYRLGSFISTRKLHVFRKRDRLV